MTVVVERYHVPPSQVWPGSRGVQQGHVHLHVVEDVKLGRLSRRAGECLCSKRRASYARPLDVGEGNYASRCEPCATIAARHGIAWPSETTAVAA